MNKMENLDLSKSHEEQFREMLEYCMASGHIDQNLYHGYVAKRGLREPNGKGVLTRPTVSADVVAYA